MYIILDHMGNTFRIFTGMICGPLEDRRKEQVVPALLGALLMSRGWRVSRLADGWVSSGRTYPVMIRDVGLNGLLIIPLEDVPRLLADERLHPTLLSHDDLFSWDWQLVGDTAYAIPAALAFLQMRLEVGI